MTNQLCDQLREAEDLSDNIKVLRRLVLEAADEIERLQKDADRLDWYEAQHTLHKSMELLYAVDRYELDVLRDGHTHLEFHGQSLRECIDAARGAPEPPAVPYYVCRDCGADLSKHPTSAAGHQCTPVKSGEQR